jgi:hypothetical protein
MSRFLRQRRAIAILAFVLLCPLLGFVTNVLFRKTLFSRWHQAQNEFLPKDHPCLLYCPTFNSLRAEYSMSASDFDAWVKSRPWPLKPIGEVERHDRELFGLTTARKSYATKISPNGKQLRVYHANDTAYISYWAF